MRTINNYIREGFYKNVKSDEITLDMLNSYIEETAKKYGFQGAVEWWVDPSTDGAMTSQLRKYSSSYTSGRTYYEIGFCIREYRGYVSKLYLKFETWYDDLEKRPRYTIELRLQQPVPRKDYRNTSCRKEFISKKCTLQWYPDIQEEIEDVISKLASLNKEFEERYKKEISWNHTVSKRTFGVLLNKFNSKWLRNI